MKNIFKIGLLVSHYSIDYNKYNLISNLLKLNGVKLNIIYTDPPKNKSNFFNKIFSKGLNKLLFALIVKYELFIFSKKTKNNKQYNLRKFNIDQININSKYSKSGLYVDYIDINKLKDFDLLIRVNSSGIFRGKILKCSRLGILSLHHGDNRWNRGGPAGFWEVYNKIPSTGFIIQILNNKLDGGDVVFRGEFMTNELYSRNISSVLDRSYYFFEQEIRKIVNSNKIDFDEMTFPFNNVILKTPRFFEIIKYFIYVNELILKKIVKRFINKSEWSVSFINESFKEASLSKAIKITNPKNRWFADPFILKKNNRNIIYVEDYDEIDLKACISCFEIFGKEYKFLGKVIEEPFHLSFPYVFEYKNELYMVPESSESKSIRLYKCIDYPLKWVYQYDLISNIDAVDTTILFFNKKYWLFTNPDPDQNGIHDSVLNCYYSDSPISQNWTSHVNNPIQFKNGARNAGRIINLADKNNLLRLGQEYDFNNYGKSLVFYKITKLSHNKYEEILINRISPNLNQKGIHHLDSIENLTVFDTYN